ncbi:hypothetical protein BA6E_124275 [Bacteroidales bacterium 6E]|nr:hypothetical protein BA6E_124275 [Bacteroidales bacterium 6E]
MELKDLKNSEELERPLSDEFELTNNESTEVQGADNEVVSEEVASPEPLEEAVVSEEPVEEAVVSEEPASQEPVVEPSAEIASKVEEVTENPETPIAEEPESVEPEPEVVAEVVTAEDPVSQEKKPETPTASEDVEAAEVHEEEEDEPDDQEEVDYSSLTQIEMVNELRALVDNEDSDERNVNLLIAAFRQKVRENLLEAKRKFVAEGGVAEEFQPEDDPYENDIRELEKKFRQSRYEQVKKLEVEKEHNLQKKYAIIDDIKNLLNTEESINKTFQEFRELQKAWYDIGPVPQSKMKDLWDTYHFHVENFYDYIKINKELRDLDLKRNLEAKISLCEKTEELLLETSVIRAFNTLQKYHEQWREIGPVPRDKKDEIWERFKAATTQINQKHQEFFEKRKVEQKSNLEAKIALCEKAEEIGAANLESHRDWDEKSKELIELQKVWRTIGFAPKRDNNRIYDRFRTACDQFFNKKREFYSQNKEVQNKNLQMKMDLCLEAEALKDSTDWKKTTQQFIDIQKRWKEVGPVPRKNSDIIWKRFRAACDYFFDRKSEHFSDVDDEQVENLKKKQALIEEVEAFVPDEDVSESLKVLREFQRRWTEIGHVPMKEKDNVQNRFRSAINKHFDTLKVDSSKRDSMRFRSKIATMTDNQRGLSKVRQEREKYMMKLKQLENDLTLLDNNIGFFANSKNAQALIADVNRKIEDTREKIEQLKEKIRIIDDLDSTEY